MTANTASLSNDRAAICVTISDIADAVGLTESIVSHALYGYPDISAKTQQPFLAEFLVGVATDASTEGYMLTAASAEDNTHLVETSRNLLQDGKADDFAPRVVVDDLRSKNATHAEPPPEILGQTVAAQELRQVSLLVSKGGKQ